MPVINRIKVWLWIVAAICIVLVFPGCGTYVWVTVKENPGIPALTPGAILGVGQFDIVLKNNPHLLILNENSDDWSIAGGFDGPANVPVITIQSPEAAKNYAVDKDLLTQMTQEIISGMLDGSKSFNINAFTGLKLEKIADRDESGARAETVNVINIPQLTSALMRTTEVTALAARYNVDMILGGDLEITAEILKATDITNDRAAYASPPLENEGEYGLYLDINFAFTLYDAKTGAVITDSRKTKAKYATGLYFMSNNAKITSLTSVPAGNQRALIKFLNSPAYVQIYENRLSAFLLNYIYLFRPHYHSFQQKIEK